MRDAARKRYQSGGTCYLISTLAPNLFELLLELLGLFLGNGFLDGLGSVVHEILGLFEAQTRDLTHDLDDLNLLVARADQLDIELGLLLGDGSATGTRHGRDGHRSGCGDIELLFKRLLELSQLKHRHVGELFQQLLVRQCHVPTPSFEYQPR